MNPEQMPENTEPKSSESSGFTEQGEQFIQNVYQKIKPEDKDSLDRVVVAGQKIMFSPETHQYMLDAIHADGDLATNIGMGIVQLMMMMFAQSKGSMPPQVIVPAGSILLTKACEYVDQTDGGMNTQIFGEALKLLVVGLHRKMSEVGQQNGQAPDQGAQTPPDAAQPPDAGQPDATQQGGSQPLMSQGA